jgi:hypothetical protein
LAKNADSRCWDVMQRMQDRGAAFGEKQKSFVQHEFSRAQQSEVGGLRDTMM